MRDTRPHPTRHLWLLIAAALLMTSGLVAAQKDAWSLSFEVSSDRYIVREPIWTRVVLTNQSGQEVPKAGAYGELYLDGSERPCRPYSGPTGPEVVGKGEGEYDPPEAPPGAEVAVWLNAGEQCRLSHDGAASIGRHEICYRDQESNGLRSRSVCASFSIEAPEGIDREAYEAFGHDPLKRSERYGDLLRRFPGSTYAAYVVWSKHAKGWASVETDRAVEVLILGFKHERGLAPCDAKLRPVGDTEIRLSGASYVQCRDAWLNSALKHHPEIWFADEIRLRLALDQYLLGEQAACSAQLEDLSIRARADVATKASQLLAALRAKGMLEGASEGQSHPTSE